MATRVAWGNVKREAQCKKCGFVGELIGPKFIEETRQEGDYANARGRSVTREALAWFCRKCGWQGWEEDCEDARA